MFIKNFLKFAPKNINNFFFKIDKCAKLLNNYF